VLRLELYQVSRKSPEFLTIYEGNDTTLNLSVGKISLGIEPESLLTALKFTRFFTKKLLEESSEPSTSENQTKEVISDTLLQPDPATKPPPSLTTNQTSTKITAKLDSVSLFLLDGTRHMFDAEVAKIQLNLVTNSKLKLDGNLGYPSAIYILLACSFLRTYFLSFTFCFNFQQICN